MSEILIVTIVVLITLFFMFITARPSNIKRTSSQRKFIVGYSQNIRVLLSYIGLLPVLFALIGVINSSFNGGVYILVVGFIVSICIWLLAIVLINWRMEVNVEILKYRNFLGGCKEISSLEVQKVVERDDKSLIIYANGKKFGTLNRDFEHLKNFQKYCELNEIAVLPQITKSITKCKLFFKAMKTMMTMGIIFGVISGTVGIVAAILNGRGYGSVGIFLVAVAAFFSMFTLCAVPLVLPGILHIKKQEAYFGISFSNEMKEFNINSVNNRCDNWFLDIDITRILAFKRGYIVEVIKIKKVNQGSGTTPQVMMMQALTINGKKIKIVGSKKSIDDLKQWLKN